MTVSDPLNYAAPRTITLRWLVGSPAGAMRGPWSKCVDDSGGNTRKGTKIDLFACNGTGTLAYIGPCTRTANQVWTRQTDGEYVLKSSGKCLSDPADARRDGTQLRLLACKGTVGQRWSLP